MFLGAGGKGGVAGGPQAECRAAMIGMPVSNVTPRARQKRIMASARRHGPKTGRRSRNRSTGACWSSNRFSSR